MGARYIFEIKDGPSRYDHFAYFDTEEYLADFLFEYEHVDVTKEGEFGAEDDPYRLIMCRIPRKQRERFLRCAEMLPGLMAYVGKNDYDEFCRDFMTNAARYMASHAPVGRNIPLQ